MMFYPLDTPNSTSFNRLCSFPSLLSSLVSSPACWLCLTKGWILEAAAFFSISTAQLYISIPTTASTIPIMFLNVISTSNSNHPNVSTHRVFMWPITWNDVAENRPMQRYWLTLQNTAREHDSSMNTCIYTLS